MTENGLGVLSEDLRFLQGDELEGAAHFELPQGV